MDKIQFHFNNSIFKNFKNKLFWDPRISWVNKYKDGNPLNGEKFFLSKSLFVGLTDGWHLFKSFRTLFIFSGFYFTFISHPTNLDCLIYLLINRIVFGASFTFFYNFFED
jgi:hypothetical protein